MERIVAASTEVLVRHVRTEAFVSAAHASAVGDPRGPRDHARFGEFLHPESDRDYLAARALTRATLAELLGSDPRLTSRHDGNGHSPEAVGTHGSQPLRFSLAYADGIAVCAVTSGGSVGVDVESARNLGGEVGDIASLVCSPAELRHLDTLAGDARMERFLTIWARREAIAKALGLGFRLPLDEAPRDSPAGASEVNVVSQRLGAHHVAAVALVRSGGEGVRVHFEEVGLDALQWSEGD